VAYKKEQLIYYYLEGITTINYPNSRGLKYLLVFCRGILNDEPQSLTKREIDYY